MISRPSLSSAKVSLDDSPEAVYAHVMSQGWGDGLPVVPPTEERVWTFIQESGLASDHVVGVVGPAEGEATVEKIAINAVMAGCLPEYMAVIIATVEGVCEEQFNLGGVQTTTNSCGVGLIINGPIRRTLDVNCGRSCLGRGSRANATMGRALSLVLMNVGGAKPGDVDKATHGSPGKYTLCFGEDEESSPWEPLHVERGFSADESTVTVNSFNGTLNTLTITYLNIVDMLWVMARDLGQMGSNNLHLGKGEPGLLITPGHARLAAEGGMSKQDVKQYIYDNSGFPASELRPMVRSHRLEPVIVDGIVHQTRRPEDVMLVVAGGPEPYHATFMPTFGDSWAVTKPIRGS